MVEGESVLHHVKREGNCPGGGMSAGEYVQGECPDPDRPAFKDERHDEKDACHTYLEDLLEFVAFAHGH